MKDTDFFSSARKLAVVDIGANSVRMNVYDIDLSSGTFSVCDSARSMLGLAAYSSDGVLSPDGEGKLFAVLREYLARANSIPADGFCAFATASLRGLENSAKVVEDMRRRLGIDIDVIDGEEEAALDFEATLSHFSGTLADRGVVIDMGGGSTEIVCFESSRAVHSVSLPIGCLALSKKLVSSPLSMTPSEREAIEKYVSGVLACHKTLSGFADTAYVIGGTARASSRIIASLSGDFPLPEGDPLSSDALFVSYEKLFADKELCAATVRKCCPDRSATAIPGMTALCAVIRLLGVKTLITSNAGVREGFILRKIKEFSNQ